VIDDEPCLIEILDTAGQGSFYSAFFRATGSVLTSRTEEYTALRDQWIRFASQTWRLFSRPQI
jgi:hypothetical protein